MMSAKQLLQKVGLLEEDAVVTEWSPAERRFWEAMLSGRRRIHEADTHTKLTWEMLFPGEEQDDDASVV